MVVWHLLWLLIYLNSPSVTKIPNLKKKSRQKRKKGSKDMQESEVLLGGRLNSSSVHILYITPHCTGDNQAVLIIEILVRFTKKQILRLVPEQTAGVGGKSFLW